MKQEFFYPSKDKITQIHAIRWVPEGTPRAILQICHGMQEYIDRYDDFASFLMEQGIYVVGNDHLGHGLSVVSEDRHGYFSAERGNERVIKDIHNLRLNTMMSNLHIPYFMLGHSMGSFLVRQYIRQFGDGLAGVIIMGTGAQSSLTLAAAKTICRIIASSRGWEYRSKLVNDLACGSYNKRFEPARTAHEWLTKDAAIVDKYEADPWCTFRFTLNAYYNMFCGIQAAQSRERIKAIPRDLPLLLVSGTEDPVGSFGKGVKAVQDQYRQCGMRDVRMKLYEGDRHEILNETDRQVVYQDLLDWMEERLAALQSA